MSYSPSYRSSTISVEFFSPATNLSLKSWRAKALVWSRIQVGCMNAYAAYTSNKDILHCNMFPPTNLSFDLFQASAQKRFNHSA